MPIKQRHNNRQTSIETDTQYETYWHDRQKIKKEKRRGTRNKKETTLNIARQQKKKKSLSKKYIKSIQIDFFHIVFSQTKNVTTKLEGVGGLRP